MKPIGSGILAMLMPAMLFFWALSGHGQLAYAQATLESGLAQRPLPELAKRARILGDSSRGAILFHRPGLSCTQCHTIGGAGPIANAGANLLGPDLTQLQERASYEHVIESLLKPSRVVRKGYQSMNLLLESGKVITGMIRQETTDALIVMVPGESDPRSIPRDEIEEQIPAGSMMPAGLINQLSDEADFFDLVSFVVALGKAGAEGAAQLKPPPELIAPQPLPAYEQELDHAGFIEEWDDDSFERGEALYNSLCINCHGTGRQAGSLPNALRFATGKFRNGADPYSIYKTITHGYRMMLPQGQLVPQQKYDVIHYLRDAYLEPHNKTQFTELDDDYLANLPQGSERGPAPVEHQPWRDMDYGPFLINTYEMVGPNTQARPEVDDDQMQGKGRQRPAEEIWPDGTNFAYKGIAIRLDEGRGGVAAGSHWLAFDHDTMRVAGAWSGEGFNDWHGILFDGRHAITPRTIGKQLYANLPGPGWAHPDTGSFSDPRQRMRDGRAYGPLPRDWMHYKGLYKHGKRVVVSYSVGNVRVLESHRVERQGGPQAQPGSDIWVRVLNVGESSRDLALRIASDDSVAVAINGPQALRLDAANGSSILRIPAQTTPLNFELRIGNKQVSQQILKDAPNSPEDLRRFTKGGPPAWEQQLPVISQIGNDDGPLAVDTLTRPTANPWMSRLRFSGLDFLADPNQMVVCCCDGDVWKVEGIDQIGEFISWRRIASGLFHPLGIKVVGDRIFVSCRDQIVILNDLNGDGETDFYENFNNDHQVTDHFHEFAMGLQVGHEGNLYYAKSARHGRDSLVPQHGTLLQVSPDGSRTDILANGFRAANGVCLNPDGSLFVTDQEGHWMPMNRINRVVKGEFFGNIYGYGAPDDTSDDAMRQPLCWVDKEYDRSPAELLWVESDQWGPLSGALLSLSYGYGKIFIVPHEQVDGQWQGGICELPLDRFSTGIMRGRFHPTNGQLYVCGMNAWASDQTAASGGLYRVRYRDTPWHLPVKLNAESGSLTITFTEPVDLVSAANPTNYLVESWTLRRTAEYGSDRYDETSLPVRAAAVAEDQRTVKLEIPSIKPVTCMQIMYKIKDASGNPFDGRIQNTVHRLRRQ